MDSQKQRTSSSVDYLIVLPTYSDYKEVTENFLQLLKKNWKECPFQVVVSSAGQSIKIVGVENVYNGKNATLTECVVSVAKKYKSKYYICFLGDAFINKKINNGEIIEILKTIMDMDVEYCSLKYVKKCKKEKKVNKYLRYINSMDRYSHNFLAFAARRDFVLGQMSKMRTDLEFEKYYLGEKEEHYYDNHLAVRKNYFGIVPGIVKGKWDRINLIRLKKSNPEINFGMEEKKQSWTKTLLIHVRNHTVSHFSPSIRIKIKRFVERVFRFEFGVKD